MSVGDQVSNRRVGVFRYDVLPYSETFVRDQIEATRRWKPVLIGMRTHHNPLSVQARTLSVGLSAGASRRFKLHRRRKGLEYILSSERVDVVHAHFGIDATYVMPSTRRLGLPLVVTFHGNDATGLPFGSSLESRLYRARLSSLFSYSTAITTDSDFIAECVAGLGAPEEKIVVHHIGIPSRDVQDSKGERAGIVFVGRLVSKKGVSDLLKAVSALPEDLRGVSVRIVGDGPLRQELEELVIRHKLNVEFVGALSSDGVARELRRSRIFVGPSKTAPSGDAEGFGIVFLEAAAAELPTVAYWHGGVGSAIADGKTGSLVAEGDVVALSDAIAVLLRNPALCDQYGRAGRARVLQEFDVATQTKLLEKVYDQAAERRDQVSARAGGKIA